MWQNIKPLINQRGNLLTDKIFFIKGITMENKVTRLFAITFLTVTLQNTAHTSQTANKMANQIKHNELELAHRIEEEASRHDAKSEVLTHRIEEATVIVSDKTEEVGSKIRRKAQKWFNRTKEAGSKFANHAKEFAHRAQEAALRAGDKISEFAQDIKHKFVKNSHSHDIAHGCDTHPTPSALTNEQAIIEIAKTLHEIDEVEHEVHEMKKSLIHTIENQLSVQVDIAQDVQREQQETLNDINKAVQALDVAHQEIQIIKNRLACSIEQVSDNHMHLSLSERVLNGLHDMKTTIKNHPYATATCISFALLLGCVSYSHKAVIVPL